MQISPGVRWPSVTGCRNTTDNVAVLCVVLPRRNCVCSWKRKRRRAPVPFMNVNQFQSDAALSAALHSNQTSARLTRYHQL